MLQEEYIDELNKYNAEIADDPLTKLTPRLFEYMYYLDDSIVILLQE